MRTLFCEQEFYFSGRWGSVEVGHIHAPLPAILSIDFVSAKRDAIIPLFLIILWWFLDLVLGEIHGIIMRYGNEGAGDRKADHEEHEACKR
jgi:hypothetical protein